MTELQITRSLEDLNKLVLTGKGVEAFEKYYHEDVEMQENDLAPTKGKDQNRKREAEFYANLVEFRSASAGAMAVNGNKSFVVWSYDYTHKQWGERKYTQVSVQDWKDGKIIKEQFFYGK